MDGYVFGGYAVTFLVLGAYALRTVLRGRSLSKHLDRDR